MSQQEILDFLKEHKTRWYDVKELSVAIGISRGSITTSMSKLIKWRFVLVKRPSTFHDCYKVRYKNE